MKRRIRVLWALPILLTVFISGILFLSDFFRIKKVIVISNSTEIRGLSQLFSENYLSLNEEVTAQKLLAVNPLIKNIKIGKTFPQTLTLNVFWRKPQAKILLDDKIILLDEEGKVSAGDPDGLTEIAGTKITLPSSGTTDWRILKSVNYIILLSKSGIRVNNIYIFDEESIFILELADGEEVKIPFQTDPDQVSASLQVIISRFRIEGKFISSIDFRFDKPLVVLKNE